MNVLPAPNEPLIEMEFVPFETIDDDIAALEEKIEIIDQEMAENATNSAKLSELMKAKEEAEQMLEEKMDRWVYLNDLNERILEDKKEF